MHVRVVRLLGGNSISLLFRLASSIGYYGLSLGARGLSGDRYINLFVSSLVELIAFILVIFLLK